MMVRDEKRAVKSRLYGYSGVAMASEIFVIAARYDATLGVRCCYDYRYSTRQAIFARYVIIILCCCCH